MSTTDTVEEAVEILQQLGLKEYEARCFIGLTRLETGTARQLSDLTEVPRTRVYDAIRVLEAQGLVQIQHSSPQQFRAVPLDEATETLQDQYEDRIEQLDDILQTVEIVDQDAETPVQQVWALTGQDAVENRAATLINKASEEIVLVLGVESLLTDNLIATLNDVDDDVELLIGTLSETLQEQVRKNVPNATTFTTGLEWLQPVEETGDETAIGRLLLVDRSAILMSSIVTETKEEKAIYGEGFENGLVVITRRLMSHGLVVQQDPAK